MWYFLRKLALFLVAGILCAYLFQWIIDYGLKKSGYSPDYKVWNEIMNSQVNADIIIQGSSTARIQVSPKALEDQFNLSAYNLGMNGGSFPYEEYKFEMFIKHNKKPKYVIQVVDANTLTNSTKVDFIQFIPYLNADLVNRFKNSFVFTNYDVYVPLYKYSHRIGAVPAALDHLFDRGVWNTGDYKGFKAFDEHFTTAGFYELLAKNHGSFHAQCNNTVYKQFVSFVAYCQKNNIKLIIVYAPAQYIYTSHLTNRDSVSGWYNKISQKYNVPFFDYSNLPLSRDTSMYMDYFHLNSKGVKAMNNILIGDLKNIIK